MGEAVWRRGEPLWGCMSAKELQSASPSWAMIVWRLGSKRCLRGELFGSSRSAKELQSASRLGSYKRQILGALGSPDLSRPQRASAHLSAPQPASAGLSCARSPLNVKDYVTCQGIRSS